MKPLDAVALIAGGVVSVAQFVLFVFVCMALKQSDTESLTNACGYILRDLLRFCVGLNTVGVFVMALIAHLAARFYGPEASPIHTVLILLYFCCTCVLDAWILYESYAALGVQRCVAAMDGLDGGDVGFRSLANAGIFSGSWGLASTVAFLHLISFSRTFIDYVGRFFKFLDRCLY